MPVTKYATHYKMDHKKRGLAYIFNHETFECGGLKARTGTNEDCRNLKECLVWLGFDVQVFKDLNLSDIQFHVRQGEEVNKEFLIIIELFNIPYDVFIYTN